MGGSEELKMTKDLDHILKNTTTVITDYNTLTRGKWLANIPVIRNNRGAPVIRNISLEGQTDHGEALRSVLTYETVDDKVRTAFNKGEFRFNLANGFHGNGFESLDEHTRSFLKRWEAEYLPVYRTYRKSLEQHDEIKNYRNVMQGALKGVTAGFAVGVGVDGLSAWTGSDNVYWEIGARSLPAILEAEEIARPFFNRVKEWANYKRGKSDKRPEPFTPTEIWSLTQLAGPVVGFSMLVIGEEIGLNQNPFYRATAVFTVNTGNNVIGSGSSYVHFLMDARKTRLDSDDFFYLSYKPEATKLRDRVDNKVYTLAQKHKLVKKIVNNLGDVYLSLCNLWADSFQSSNIGVASAWYGAEVALRYFGIAAENVSFGDSKFGGKSLAALESGLLSCDTAAAAKVAIEREKMKLHGEVKKLVDRNYLARLYAA